MTPAQDAVQTLIPTLDISERAARASEARSKVETGVKFRLLVDRTIETGVTLNHRDGADELQSLSVSVPLGNTNVLEVNTNSGQKEANINGISMLYGVSPYAQWITLTPGLNYIRVFVEGAAVPFTLEYTHKYGGI